MFFQDNPWAETPALAQKAAIARVVLAAAAAESAAKRHPNARLPLRAIASSAHTIARAWDKDADSYRTHRRFGAVDAPEIEALCSALAQQGETLDTQAVVALQDLAERTQATAETVANLPTTTPTTTDPEEEDVPTGRFGRFTKSVVGLGTSATSYAQQASKATLDVGAQGLSLASDGYQWAQSNASSVATKGLAPGKAAIKGLMAIPSGRTLLRTTMNFGDVGILTCIFFPPAVPVLVGLSLMEAAVASYEESYTQSRKNDAATLRRQEQRRAHTAARMTAILGFESAQPQAFGTDHVHMIVDPTNGAMDGRILTGRHAGTRLVDIDADAFQALVRHAPDGQTKAILQQWKR